MAKRVSLRPSFWIIASVMCVGASIWQRHRIAMLWDDPKIVNFLAAWIPFALSILLAFVPDSNMTGWKKAAWRVGVIAIGFAWSVVLWHQEVITEQAATKDQTNIVTAAVAQSNAHSDTKIGEVQTEVQGVKSEVQGVKKDLGETIQRTISQSVFALNQSIGKVGKPDPPELAKIEFRLVDDDGAIHENNATPTKEADGSYSISFMVTNDSNVQATELDIWVHLCAACTFAQEPEGFEHPAGETADTRHMFVGNLNAGVTLKKMTVHFATKVITPNVGMAFTGACKSCGKASKTSDFILHINPLPNPQL